MNKIHTNKSVEMKRSVAVKVRSFQLNVTLHIQHAHTPPWHTQQKQTVYTAKHKQAYTQQC